MSEGPASTGWERHWDEGTPDLAERFRELTPNDAARMVQSIGLALESEPTLVSRQENRVFKVDVHGGSSFALKVFRHGRVANAELLGQLRFASALEAGGAPVSAPVALPQGLPLGGWKGQQFALFPWLGDSGDWPRTRRRADLQSIGAAIAQIHMCRDDVIRHAKHYTPDTWGRASLVYLIDEEVVHPDVRQSFVEATEALLEKAREVWPDESLVPIHSDLGPWNVHWANRGLSTVLDFEDLGLGVAWQDLYLIPHILSTRGYCDAETAVAVEADLREGYATVRRLPQGGPSLSGVLEALRSIYLDCWTAARRQDRHFSVNRLTFHTKRYWTQRVERLNSYRNW